ncbi:MAG: hypothetical protein HFJ45_02350 [Clostridia bacterium]|nr:hypothetical protein [Clostridia bacterium]
MKNIISNLDKKSFDLIIKFEYISFFISLIGIIGLYIFLKFYINSALYTISISLFKAGLLAGVCSFCFGMFFNGLNKGLIKK